MSVAGKLFFLYIRVNDIPALLFLGARQVMHSIASKLASHTSNKITNHVGKIIKSSLGSRSKVESLHENCPYSEFLWPLFSCIWTEYSVQMRENTDQKKLRNGHFSRSESYRS